MANTAPPSSTVPRWAGPERRRFDRSLLTAPRIIGEARVRPEHAQHAHAVDPRFWYPVLERNPEALDPVARPGYLWIAIRGRPVQVWAAHFDVTVDPPPEE
jgi:hypothetical protein